MLTQCFWTLKRNGYFQNRVYFQNGGHLVYLYNNKFSYLAIRLCTTFVRSKQSIQLVLTTPPCSRRASRARFMRKWAMSSSEPLNWSIKSDKRSQRILLHSLWKSKPIYLQENNEVLDQLTILNKTACHYIIEKRSNV